jgi:hypothetical protein
MKYSSTLMLYFRFASKPQFLTLNFLNFPLQGSLLFFGSRFVLFVLTFLFGKLSSSLSLLLQALLLGLGLYSLLLGLLSSSILLLLFSELKSLLDFLSFAL